MRLRAAQVVHSESLVKPNRCVEPRHQRVHTFREATTPAVLTQRGRPRLEAEHQGAHHPLRHARLDGAPLSDLVVQPRQGEEQAVIQGEAQPGLSLMSKPRSNSSPSGVSPPGVLWA